MACLPSMTCNNHTNNNDGHGRPPTSFLFKIIKNTISMRWILFDDFPAVIFISCCAICCCCCCCWKSHFHAFFHVCVCFAADKLWIPSSCHLNGDYACVKHIKHCCNVNHISNDGKPCLCFIAMHTQIKREIKISIFSIINGQLLCPIVRIETISLPHMPHAQCDDGLKCWQKTDFTQWQFLEYFLGNCLFFRTKFDSHTDSRLLHSSALTKVSIDSASTNKSVMNFSETENDKEQRMLDICIVWTETRVREQAQVM